MGYQKTLMKIKPMLEVNKDLKITELENDIKYLKAQNAKLKKATPEQKLSPQDIKEKTKAHIDSMVIKIQRLKLGIAKLKLVLEDRNKKIKKQRVYRNFIQDRIIQIFGSQGYIAIVNHVDNPEPRNLIITNKQKARISDNGKL